MISGVQLSTGGEDGGLKVATVDMANVLVKNKSSDTGGLLHIARGSTVNGVNLTFANGTASR